MEKSALESIISQELPAVFIISVQSMEISTTLIEVPEWAMIFIRTHSVTKSGCHNHLFCTDGRGRETTINIGRNGSKVAEFSHNEGLVFHFSFRDKTDEEKSDKIAEIYGKKNVHYVKPKSIRL